MLGFDWQGWTGFVRDHPVLNVVLRAAYFTLLLQILASIGLLAWRGPAGRNAELLCTVCTALLVCCAGFALLPALGPWVHYGAGNFSADDLLYRPHLEALRAGTGTSFDLRQMQGIIVLPSFHTTLAVLFTWAQRGSRARLSLFGAVNLLMLFSIPSEGGHYLVDMIAGAAAAGLAIALVQVLGRGARRTDVAAEKALSAAG